MPASSTRGWLAATLGRSAVTQGFGLAHIKPHSQRKVLDAGRTRASDLLAERFLA